MNTKLTDIPMPPVELRRTVGVEDTLHFENPYGVLAFGDAIPGEAYERVLDFGCGCGRVARQMLLQQSHVPLRYVGIDIFEPSVNWCRSNLVRPGWDFIHFNAFNLGLNPGGTRLASIGLDETFTLVNAHSVFTHIIEEDLEHYFGQAAKVLADGGVIRTTWFLFDKKYFPMMQEFQNCLYINSNDPTNATIYDQEFIRTLFSRHGLTIKSATPPAVRGHQWVILAERGTGAHADFPPDAADFGLARPPVTSGLEQT